MISVEEIKKEKLRTGFTTGTSATAAAKAGLLSIINQTKIESVDVKLPKGSFIKIPIHLCKFGKNKSTCCVIKDGGDDPDVTHGAEIVVELSLTDKFNEIEIDGGEGVGIVTKPGLGLELNKAAINPVPKKMIKENLNEILEKHLLKSGVKVIISVPKGRELGPKTDNPSRLRSCRSTRSARRAIGAAPRPSARPGTARWCRP
jgi:cobalt-precorrin-5B (C1)-methyltransferase